MILVPCFLPCRCLSLASSDGPPHFFTVVARSALARAPAKPNPTRQISSRHRLSASRCNLNCKLRQIIGKYEHNGCSQESSQQFLLHHLHLLVFGHASFSPWCSTLLHLNAFTHHSSFFLHAATKDFRRISRRGRQHRSRKETR